MSETPEEQPSTGVLGRIGSWLSPWRGNSPKSPSENVSPTSDDVFKSGGEEEESEESVRPQQEEEKGQIPVLSRDIFLCEGEDATQSARRDGSVLTAGGGPEEEEFVGCKKKRTGQGKEREESGNGTSESGNPEKNASHLTHLSSSPEQGLLWDSERAHAQPQAQKQAQTSRRRLQVYLEETSVVQCAKDKSAGKEVVTKVKTSLQVLPKLKSSESLDWPNSTSSTNAGNKRTNVTPFVGAQSYYSALVGVSLKSHTEPDQEQTEEDNMGRKNSAKRRYRKNSQGDGGNSPQQENVPANAVSEGIPASDNTVTNTQGKSPNPHMGESSENSSSKHNPSSQSSPEGGQGKTSCPDSNTQLDDFQDSNTAVSAAMEEAEIFYKVERKTETPESKRRSLKVSRSEVKFFPKNVALNSKQSPADDSEDFMSTLKNTNDEAQNKPKTETDSRKDILKNIDEEPKTVDGKIADKISLFEHPAGGVSKLTMRPPRTADVSPVRKATEQQEAVSLLSDQRSRSAERYGTARSNSASPVRDNPMTIKERMKNFTEVSKARERPALPQKPVITRTPQKTTMSAASKSQELDNQGKQDTKKRKQAEEKTEIASKPDGQDMDVAGISFTKEQPSDSKTKDTLASKTADQDTKPSSAETPVLSQGTGESTELTSISPQSKGPNRTGSRSKRKKSKEPSSPLSPNSENKTACSTAKPEVKAVKTKQGDDTETIPASTEKAQEKTLDKQSAFKTELKEFDEQKKLLDSSSEKDNIVKPVKRQGGLPEPSVSKDEPDTAACSSATKKPIDKDPVIIPQNEEKAGGLFTQEQKRAFKDTKETPASSPSPAAKKTSLKEQESSAEYVKLNNDLSLQSESENEGKIKEPNKKEAGQTDQSKNKDTELRKHTETKDTGKFVKGEEREKTKQAENKEVDKIQMLESEKTKQSENVESKDTKQAGSKDMAKSETGEKEKTNNAEKKDKDKPQQLLHSDENTTKIKVTDSVKGIPRTEGAVVKDEERKEETQLVKDETKPDTNQPEQASEHTSSDLPAQTQHRRETTSTHPQKAAVSTVTHTAEAVSGIKSDKDPSKVETATNVQKKSTESSGTEKEPVLTAVDPRPNSVSMEKTEDSTDDSCAHGGNDAELSSPKPITKAASAVGEVTVEASNDTPALITVQSDNTAQKEPTVKDPTPISVLKSVSSNEAGQDVGGKNLTVKSMPSEVQIPEDITKLPSRQPQQEESKGTQNKCDTSLKGPENKAQASSDSTNSAAKVVEKKAEEKLNLANSELSTIAKGDISQHPQPNAAKKELLSTKPSQTPKTASSPEAKKPSLDPIQRSLKKKLNLPRELSKGDSATSQDSPSSWLDVDVPKRKLKVSMPKLTSAGSESNLLDTPDDLDDDDFVEKIKKLCAPFSLPPRKHNPIRPPQPPFALPAIKEARFEKTFDPEEFKFGLRKNKKFAIDSTLSTLTHLQNVESKVGQMPTRANLANRSMLINSLDTHSRLRDKTPVNQDEDVKEEKDDQNKRKSRLEGSCVLSSLSSSFYRGKRNGVQTQAEGTNSGDVSPSDSPQISPPPVSQPPQPSPTATAPLNNTLAKQIQAQRNKEEAPAGEPVAGDSGPPLPSFNDIKLPDYLEKYLPREPKPELSVQGQEQVRTEVTREMTTPAPEDEADMGVKPGLLLPDAVTPRFPGNPPTTHPTLSELKQPPAQPQGILSNNMRTAKGFHKRPGKMVLFEKTQFSGQAFEIYRDVTDATSLQLSPLISVKVVRGCWVLYEKPDFQGRCIALEEGAIELSNVWAEPGPELGTEAQNSPPMLIGSIRLAVWDYSLPHIDLFTEPEGRGRVTPYHDDTIETGSFGIPLSTASIQVHSGVWLVFSDPGFQGMIAVLETGVYPFPETWGFPSPFVGSIRPLKIGGFKVENPNEVKAVVYEKPGFEGACLEIDSDVFSFCDGENAADGVNPDSNKIKSVRSLKVIGGLWVGYSHPGFEGQQYVLEEGEYIDCSQWGGPEQLLSLRPILADFMSPHLKMFSDRNFGELGVNIDLSVPIFNMDDTGYGNKTQSIDVISGVWVVFEEPGFCGESYILEKGLYGSPEDWGALQPRVASAMPVVLDDFENTAKFKVQLFSDPGFQGTALSLEDSVASLQDGFSVASCKVLAGSWMAFEGQDFAGRMYVIEVGDYPDLRAMGCFNSSSSILSLQTVGFEFSLPSITVFERCGLRGKRVILTDGSVNLQLAGGCSRVQSVLVEGGMWVLYEEINYRGAQILLKPGEVPDWHKFCSWRKIGSLRPLQQKQVHFRLRNRQTRLMMSLTGGLDDVKLMRIQETEETDGFEQIWLYQNGHLRCKLLEECCLSPSGSVTMAGSRVGLIPEPQNNFHLWSITPEGFIRYTPTPNLVLEVKGGHNYDKTQVILNTFDPHKLHQRWDVEII